MLPSASVVREMRFVIVSFMVLFCSQQTAALSLSKAEFHASREMACVLAGEALGHLNEEEYGQRFHEVMNGFDDVERDSILAKALGYYDGLMFDIPSDEPSAVKARLETYVASEACSQGMSEVTISL